MENRDILNSEPKKENWWIRNLPWVAVGSFIFLSIANFFFRGETLLDPNHSMFYLIINPLASIFSIGNFFIGDLIANFALVHFEATYYGAVFWLGVLYLYGGYFLVGFITWYSLGYFIRKKIYTEFNNKEKIT